MQVFKQNINIFSGIAVLNQSVNIVSGQPETLKQHVRITAFPVQVFKQHVNVFDYVAQVINVALGERV